MERTIEQIVQEVADWSATTFPDDLLEDMMRKLDEEHGELHEAVATYVGPWSDLDGPFHPARACQIGDVRRHDLLDEIADNVFVLVRLASALGADFREVLQNKWDIVRARDYSGQVKFKHASNDHPPMNERSSDDERTFVIAWPSGPGFYLALGEGVFHWVAGIRRAARFTEDEARAMLDDGTMVDEQGQLYKVRDVGAIALNTEGR